MSEISPKIQYKVIRGLVEGVCAQHPLTPGMSPKDLNDLHQSRVMQLEIELQKLNLQDEPNRDYAFKLLNAHKNQEANKESDTSPEQKNPKGKINWTRFEKDGDASRLYEDVQTLKEGQYYKALTKGRIAMFVKFPDFTSEVRKKIDLAKVLAEYRNYNVLRDENIVPVYDAAWIRTDKGEEHPFVATKFLNGIDLEKWRNNIQTCPTLKQCGEIVRILASALQRLLNVPEKRVRELFPEAEGAEVLHLDLKPDNVMVEERKDGTFFLIDKSNLIIIDFGSGGVAGVANGHANELYTAPERLLDKTHRPPPDRTWDIFSLGAILYYLCTGKDPMSAKGCTRGEWTRYVLSIDLRDSKDQRGADLTLICRKCLAFDSKDRYSSPGLLEEDLQAWLTDHPIPNVGRTYKWWELERLLIRRCGKDDDIIDATRFTGRGGQDDDIIDASQFAGRVCLLLAMSMVLAATIHTWMVYSGGYTPSDSYFGTSLLACGLSTAFLLGFGWAIHWRFAYFRLFLPLMAGVVGIHLIFSFDGQIDSLYKPPKLSHLKEAYPYAVILVAVTVFIIGSSEKRWSAMKYLGVASFILALFSYQLANNETFVNYLPVPIVAHEATIATLFGLSLMKVSAQKSDDKPKSSLEKM